jgi:hypothetical protein
MLMDNRISLSEIRGLLKVKSSAQLLEIIQRLARFKKDNKELLAYLLFQSDDESAFINDVNHEVSAMFESMNKRNVHLIKKTVRKTIRYVSKMVKFAAMPRVTVEIYLHWCKCFILHNLHKLHATALDNLYISQTKKIDKAYEQLHPDVQQDYTKEMYELIK